MNRAWLLIPLAAAGTLGCHAESKPKEGLVAVPQIQRPATRPRDPWVFRSVLDGHARMLTVALADDCWITYDTQACSLVKAWKGKVFFTGGVYDTKHGPQPRSVGETYFSATRPAEVDTTPVLVLKNGSKLKPHYHGYQVAGNAVVIKYGYNGGAEVVELPERGAGGLVRTLRGTNIPAGAALELPVMSRGVTLHGRTGKVESLARAGNSATVVRAGGNFDVDVIVPLEIAGQ